MLLVARCRAAGVTMLGRHATETRAAAHSMALVIALDSGGASGGGGKHTNGRRVRKQKKRRRSKSKYLLTYLEEETDFFRKQELLPDQVIRENPASRGTEASATYLLHRTGK